jgi:hypothetical protein
MEALRYLQGQFERGDKKRASYTRGHPKTGHSHWIRLHPIKTQQLSRVGTGIVCSLPGHVIVAAHTISLRQQEIHVKNIFPRKRQVQNV